VAAAAVSGSSGLGITFDVVKILLLNGRHHTLNLHFHPTHAKSAASHDLAGGGGAPVDEHLVCLHCI
jgi:hypothetical protein